MGVVGVVGDNGVGGQWGHGDTVVLVSITQWDAAVPDPQLLTPNPQLLSPPRPSHPQPTAPDPIVSLLTPLCHS